MADERRNTAVIWTDRERSALVGEVLGRMPTVTVLAVGGPSRAASSELAEASGAAVVDDFRKMLVDHRPGTIVLAGSEGVSRKELREARGSGVHVIAIEPPDSELDAGGGGSDKPGKGGGNGGSGGGGGVGSLAIAPWFRLAPAWRSAAEPEQVLGKVRGLTVTCVGPAASGSLFARLYDAYESVGHLIGLPDAVAASLTGPLAETPDDLRAMSGHLTAHLRFRDGVAACVTASDRAFAFRRRLHALGTTGQLTIEDDRYHLWNEDGSLVDSLVPAKRAAAPGPAELIAQQWQRVLDGGVLPRPVDPAGLVACCHATLLSCRTGEIESTATMLRVAGG